MKGIAILACVAAFTLAVTARQHESVAKPPQSIRSAGPFSATRLDQSPAIDGREWIAMEAEPVSEDGEIRVKSKSFSLVANDCGDRGDFVRCHVLFRRAKAAAVPIDADTYTGWVFVTPDERYIVMEPLEVLDVQAWKRYALSDALKIPNYTEIRAMSRDGQRLLVARTDCPMDCRGDQRFEYYEVRLP